MKSDIEIAQEAVMLPITEVAKQVGISQDDLELYGKYKAKLSDECMARLENAQDGKLVLVTAINPTPAGEGKTTTSIGLAQAMGKLGNGTGCMIASCSKLKQIAMLPFFALNMLKNQ